MSGNKIIIAEEMEAGGTAGEIRREVWNLRYDYFFPMADPETEKRKRIPGQIKRSALESFFCFFFFGILHKRKPLILAKINIIFTIVNI